MMIDDVPMNYCLLDIQKKHDDVPMNDFNAPMGL